MAYNHATAAPLMADVDAKWDAYKKFSEQQGTAVANSAIAPWVDIVDANEHVAALNAAIVAMSEYIATLAE